VAEDRALGKLAVKELKAFRKGGGKGIPWEQVKKELGCDMAYQVILTDAASRSLRELPVHIQKE
jgi:hypothetical protein